VFTEVRSFHYLLIGERVRFHRPYSADMFRDSHCGKSSEGRTHHERRRTMKSRFTILFAAALVSISGATACERAQEELQKRAQEEVEKGRKQVEQRVQEERTKIEKQVQEKVQEGRQRVEEEVKKGQQQVKEKGQ
jgi:ASC-1-like (ASCH) protein